MPKFVRLNHTWNAEPNAPDPEVSVAGSNVQLLFRPDGWRPGTSRKMLVFSECAIWRLGPTNDEGWYLGQCRYSKIAPAWGEFYELEGYDPLRYGADDWLTPSSPGAGDNHYLFYFRDETFECMAAGWTLSID
ncbi:hypothetical protein GOB57_21210 [Sinorhizobium meliloti]|nr:hypothetical protein [Sinorhizobium meliloti]